MLDRRQVTGWVSVCISVVVGCFWAFWGVNENFHEGWFATDLWSNLGLMFVQYLSPTLAVIVISVIALCWPRLAIPLSGFLVLLVLWFFRAGSAAVVMIVLPLVLIGTLYHFGRPAPRAWALKCLIGFPFITALICGAYPGWMAIHRVDDGNYGMRRVVGNGITLFWAPQGPGWPHSGTSWYQAKQSCTYLNADGDSLSETPQNVWRLPSVDEAVRSLVFRGSNAGGSWDSTLQRAHYQVTPDKDSPLWKVHSQVIYWWTSTESGENEAYYITYNGFVLRIPKKIAPGYLAFRCVRERP